MQSRKPEYQRVVDWVREEIAAGRLAPGAKIPSRNQLAEQFGVSLGTVDRALYTLAERGITYGRPGLGTYVTEEET